LDKLLIQVKHEFNASNKDLYKKEALLAEGTVKEPEGFWGSLGSGGWGDWRRK